MSTHPPDFPAALARLWAKFLPEIESRVAIVESAASAFAAGELTAEQRQKAHAAAHKLAGTLGMFGLPRGTELARQAELALMDEPPSASAAQLATWAAEMRETIASHS